MTAVQRVQQLAEERDLTLYQVSTLCDIPYSTLKSTIRRGGDISIETAAMVCRGDFLFLFGSAAMMGGLPCDSSM